MWLFDFFLSYWLFLWLFDFFPFLSLTFWLFSWLFDISDFLGDEDIISNIVLEFFYRARKPNFAKFFLISSHFWSNLPEFLTHYAWISKPSSPYVISRLFLNLTTKHGPPTPCYPKNSHEKQGQKECLKIVRLGIKWEILERILTFAVEFPPKGSILQKTRALFEESRRISRNLQGFQQNTAQSR